jgi:hypothetical protein
VSVWLVVGVGVKTVGVGVYPGGGVNVGTNTVGVVEGVDVTIV